MFRPIEHHSPHSGRDSRESRSSRVSRRRHSESPEENFEKTRNAQRSTKFVFTSYECESSERYSLPLGVKYICWQIETCPDTGRQHRQGCLLSDKRVRWKQVQEWINDPVAHIECMRGTIAQAIAYCHKLETAEPESFCQFGIRPPLYPDTPRGAKDSLNAGIPINDESHPSVHARYQKWVDKITFAGKKRDWIMDCRFYWGPTGSGKTVSVFTEFGDDIYTWEHERHWFDGYRGQICILVDDVAPDFFQHNRSFLLRLTDSKQQLLDQKGTSMPILSHVIIFTSNFLPKELDDNNHNGRDLALLRRIKDIRVFPVNSE